MRLAEFIGQYCSAHDLAAKYAKYLYTCQRALDAFTGDKPLEAITVDDLNGWTEEEAKLWRKVTVKHKLSTMLTLLRAAANATPALRPPLVGQVKRIKVPQHIVIAFTPEEVAKLLAGAQTMPGWFARTGIKKSDWCEGIVRTGWDVGMRAGDLLELEEKDIDPETLIVVKVQAKTGWIHEGRLQPETWEVIQRIRRQGVCQNCPYVFPFVGGRHKFCAFFRKLAERSGVKGTSKYIRRAGATQIWDKEGPAAAAKYLGHMDGTGWLAWKNYVDRRQLSGNIPMPPPLPPPIETE